ncbi:hypothetical protein [Endozoicomonas sp. ONNA2]|uniref:hypothetical protein n=1 Tax=Endozoicomonas sp. ONNA2 TaxID=2828741 RepID=UPI002147E26E|nr:hypothetical protein [Endozoicomonas sp. ONNA2]
MSNQNRKSLVPELRFAEYRTGPAWQETKIGENLKESRIKGHKGNVAKKLTVKLWGNGVQEKRETYVLKKYW